MRVGETVLECCDDTTVDRIGEAENVPSGNGGGTGTKLDRCDVASDVVLFFLVGNGDTR